MGELRGGTPPLDGDQYLGFFHSYFRTEDFDIKIWYVMGAYAFEKDPPFRMIGISKEPIIFTSLYDSRTKSAIVDPIKRVAYPAVL